MELRINQDGLTMLCGYLGRDPEQKQTQSGKNLTTFSVAIGKRQTSDVPEATETVWRNIACWRQLGESAARLHKGDTVFVIGTLSVNEYTDREGNKKTSETINAEAFFVTPSAYSRPANGNNYSAPSYGASQGVFGQQQTNYPTQNTTPYGQPQQPYGQQPGYGQQQYNQQGFGQPPQNGGFMPIDSKEDLPF